MWSSLIYGSYKTDEQNQILEIKFLQSKLADKKRSCSVHFHVDLLSKISTQCCQIVQDLYLELSCWGIPCCSGKLLCVLEKLLGIDIDILWYMMYIYIYCHIYIYFIFVYVCITCIQYTYYCIVWMYLYLQIITSWMIWNIWSVKLELGGGWLSIKFYAVQKMSEVYDGSKSTTGKPSNLLLSFNESPRRNTAMI